jgi:hypothetical protein
MKAQGRVLGLLLVMGLGVSSAVSAQTGGSSIVGSVRDETGAAIPGVTVEAASPVLIERVKTVVTNASGGYQIVDLRAGAYTVTFTLAGFKVVKHEGVELAASFTATVNATLAVGGLEETLTVTGESPLVDLRNSVSGRALNQQILEELPVARNVYQVGLMMPGATTTAPDVGGNQTAQITNLRVHGVSDNTWLADGIEINGVEADTVTATYYNQGFNEEMTIQTSALPAESGGGVTVNMVKKDGSNSLKGDFYATATGKALQSNNVSDEQRANGLVAPSATDQAYDINGGVGGPVLRDRLWFYGSYRRWRVDRLTANTFNVDGTQALDEQILSNWSGRLTLKLNDSNRVSGWVETLDKLRGHRRNTSGTFQFISPEAAVVQPNVGLTASIKWTSTVRSNLLIEGGFASMRIVWGQHYEPDSPPNALPRNDLDYSTLTGATPNALDSELDWRKTAAFTVTWLPNWMGQHKIKVGTQLSYGNLDDVRTSRTDLLARYRSGVPDSVVVYNTPITTAILQRDHAWYIQDGWTIGRRLTVNAGLRWQLFRGIIPAQTSPAGTFVGERTFPKIDNVPNWTDYTPRLAASYDLVGNGKTALKVSVSRYISRTSAGSIISAFNPLRLLSETRTWNDANRDTIPQLTEIGATRGGLTSAANVRIDPNLTRPYQWEQSVTLEHQLRPTLALAASYYHRKFTDAYATVNVAVQASDYTPVTIRNPLDGSPFTVYNQSAASASRVDNVVTNSAALKSWYNAFEIAVDKRMSNNFQLFGGITIGADRNCTGASTNPNDQVNNCGYANADSRFMGNLSVVYRLPKGVNLSSHVQQLSGQPLATSYTVTRADIPNLTQVSQSVNLLPTGERRKDAWTLIDLRLSKTFRFANRRSIEPLAELYNITNENAALSQVTTVGPTFGRVSSNVDGRIARFGLKILF